MLEAQRASTFIKDNTLEGEQCQKKTKVKKKTKAKK